MTETIAMECRNCGTHYGTVTLAEPCSCPKCDAVENQYLRPGITGADIEGMTIDEVENIGETEEEKKIRLQAAIDAAIEDAQVRQAVVDKLMAPTRALYAHLKGSPPKKHVHDPKIAGFYREVMLMRKKYFRLRRLPKGHPDKITGPIPEMEN